MKFVYNDGGRKDAGFKGTAGDCTVRAISIVLEKDYMTVYNDLFTLNKANKNPKNSGSPRDGGTSMVTIKSYMASNNFKWVPTMTIGSGCKTHLIKSELPMGRVMCRVTKHITSMIDGQLNDTYDCSRDGTRCVYGYWVKE